MGAACMYIFATLLHPHGHRLLQELLGNRELGNQALLGLWP